MKTKWIKSAGGPLICVESSIMQFWCGVNGNSVSQGIESTFPNDYARACEVEEFLGLIVLAEGNAMVLGDMPIETAIWHVAGQLPMIVRVYYSDPNIDVIHILESEKELDFSDPLERVDIEIGTTELVIFDSAYSGNAIKVSQLSFEIPVGTYAVLTKQFEPDNRTSVLIHRFVSRAE